MYICSAFSKYTAQWQSATDLLTHHFGNYLNSRSRSVYKRGPICLKTAVVNIINCNSSKHVKDSIHVFNMYVRQI